MSIEQRLRAIRLMEKIEKSANSEKIENGVAYRNSNGEKIIEIEMKEKRN